MAIDRLIGILAILLREEKATAAQLAARLEVDQRTIYRDMERLCRAGIPLRSQRGKNGGISIMEGYAMERTLLTDADRGAILAGLRSLDSVSGTGYYRHLMEKLPQSREAAADDCVVIDLASWYGPVLAPRLAELKEACAGHRAVRFTYCAPAGDSRRVVEPDKLVFRWSSWYLHGWCREREDWRLFKLGRMLDLEVLTEEFAPRDAPWPITPPERVYPETLEAVVRFQPAARWRLIDEYGAESFTREADGTLLFRRGFPDRAELIRWALSFLDQAEVLEPAEVRAEICRMAEILREKYDK
ncbi:MAG: YafY family transcriptional regulator [Oscillospiraceae bacterium]|jgi:predicted DNA-binding transcriptional regulator YafY|nr:YafY family transcriptional regulator [Oscillospiraceae bacterium]